MLANDNIVCSGVGVPRGRRPRAPGGTLLIKIKFLKGVENF